MKKINAILTIGILGATLAIGFTGCGKEPIPPKQMTTSKIDSINVEYKFKDNLNDKPITKNQVVSKIISNISKSSGYKKKVILSRNVRTTYGHVVEYDNNILTINYLNGNQNCGGKCKSKYGQVTQVIFNSKLNIKKISRNNFMVSASFPTKYVIKPDSSFIGSEFDPLDKPNKLESDSKKMFNAIKQPIKISRNIEFKGEVNTKYPDKAVYANFKRILGNYSWRNYNRQVNDVKKQNTFSIKINNKRFPLFVEVYPYRDGSKVIYSSNLKYTIDSKGNTTLTKEDISKLHKKIKNIINN